MAAGGIKRLSDDVEESNGALVRHLMAYTPVVEVLPTEESRVSRLIHRVEALKHSLDAEKRRRVKDYRDRLANVPVAHHHACPFCQCTTIFRSHRRNASERVLTPIMLPYRCSECGARFYVGRFADRARPANVAVAQHRACPRCQCRTIVRSHRKNLLEMMLTPIMLPYRCDQCEARFYLRHASPKAVFPWPAAHSKCAQDGWR